ncbi:uncharacterized protein LOC141719284 [Apium graveolens]|uniref:uncharacterized protein LOC141719284 n=1 Tax=Apium graveolens TaxID=4045 RepID=UPI003D7A8700
MEANISNKSKAAIPLIEVNVSDTEVDPGLRKPINGISPNEKDKIRRTYYECGVRGNNETFVNKGYRNWKMPERLGDHIGKHNSIHSQCQKACEDLMNRKQHVDIAIVNQLDQLKHNYRIQLVAAIDCVKLLLVQGLAFRGHDVSETSRNRGNFLVVLKFLTSHSPDIKDVFKNAPENNKLTAPSIQKDITNACAVVTSNAISLELGDGVFSILVDKARDISNKE